jgi:hypothetical protein
VGVNGLHGLQHLHGLVAQGYPIVRKRRFHRRHTEELEQVVLDHVAHDPGAIIIAGTGANAFGLCDGDLHVINIVAVPDGLKARIGKAEDQHILDRLFAQVMIDPVELLFAHHREELAVQGPRGGGIIPKGFFENNPPPAVRALEEGGVGKLLGNATV